MKTFTKLLFVFCASLLTISAVAQNSGSIGHAEVGPNTLPGSGTINTQALFDTQFNYNITVSTNGSLGNAGIVNLGSEFWIAKWQSDTVWRLDNSGTLVSFFNIPLSPTGGGIRAMTTDGSFVYAAQNGPEIVKIDIASESIIGTISLAGLGFNARSVTYDATADGGAGGFWVSNFGTDIVLINMTGTVLSTLPAATHTLTGMYGTVVDNISSTTQQYLWVFNQPANPGAQIWQIETATGTQTGVNFDVNGFFGFAGLAGGICIATGIAPLPSLVCLVQQDPNNVVGLELPTPVGLSENDFESTVGVFPIPASESINFVIKDKKSDLLQIHVYDVKGKLVKEFNSSETKITISTKEFTSGIYTVKIYNGENTVVRKFMVN